MFARCSSSTARVVSRSALEITSVSQSGSAATTRPPGRTTRAISATTPAGSATCCRARLDAGSRELPSGEGKRVGVGHDKLSRGPG